MSEEQFYHALKVDEDTCFGCTHCMHDCPTGAIRIRNGKATIRKDWCVDCGECMKSCPVDAIYVEQDDFIEIFNYKYRVAIVPAVFFGQFPENISEERILSVMNELGFTHVFQAEHTVDIINEVIIEFQDAKSEKPLISSFCPAIVRLIQVKFPALVDHIVPVKPPIDASAAFYKYLLIEKGATAEEIGIFYVTPCAAKIAAVKSPVGDDQNYVDGVINMDFLYNKVYQVLKSQTNTSSTIKQTAFPQLTSKGLKWSLTDGEADHMKGRCLAIDEIHNVINFLERLENEEISDVDFLELRACDQSCAGGVLLSGNRFLGVERLRNRARVLENRTFQSAELESFRCFIKKNIHLESLSPRSMMKLDEDMGAALKKMQRIRHIMCFLPGIDCGACGAPNCQSLAEDIVRKEAHLSNCVFIQRMMEKTRKLSPDHAIRLIENTWGKDRLDKDCKKKGAKNEGM